MDNAIVKKRIDWVDIAKGITMLLVIFGHSEIGQLRGVIFSFHMPFFFICSGITLRVSENKEQFIKNTKRSFIHLMTNALLIFALYSVLEIIFVPGTLTDVASLSGYLLDRVIVFIAGSGAKMQLGSLTIVSVGISWFLIALFFGRTIFDLLHLACKKHIVFYILIAVCSIAGVIIGQIQWLPFSLDIVLTIQPFFLFGHVLRNKDLKKNKLAVCAGSLAVWFGSFFAIIYIASDYLEFASRHYPVYPLCLLCAAGGSLFVICISMLISDHFNRPAYPLKILGKHSLIMLWIHSIDGIVPFIGRAYSVSGNGYINAGLRILVDCVLFALVILVMWLYRRIRTQTDRK